MFQIKYDKVFLDLAPNQDCEFERNSPLFLIDNFFAEYSTPITLAYSDTNARALGWYFFSKSKRVKQKFNVEVYDKGTYKCNAVLALESAGMNDVHKGASTAGGYLLIGISDFLQTIQTKKLTDLILGGDRTFDFTTWDPSDGSGGYFQHFHTTWLGGTDYVFATCRNDTWTGSADDPFATGYMNALDTSGADATLKKNEPVVPFVYIKFILESIFKESGWSVDFTGLNDIEWQQLVLWSVKPLFISQQTFTTNPDTNELDAVYSPLGQITIHLADFMPTDYTCAQFMTALCMRYGWAIIPSTTKRSARFVALKEMKNKAAKNWTQYAAAASSTQISVDAKAFAFKQDFEGSDGFPSDPDFTGWTILNAVETEQDLPAVSSSAFDSALIYVYRDNQYYNVVVNDDQTARLWQVYTDNIYDVDPPDGVDATDTFETRCTTLPVYKTLWRNSAGIDYYAYFPVCSQSRTEKFGIKTIKYFGLATDTKVDGTIGSYHYPYASSTCTRHDDPTPLTWANVYKQVDTDGNDRGIISYWFQNWLDIISNVEDAFKKRYYLPLIELLKFQWDDIIVDNNIPYVIKQIIEPVPYKGFVECIMQRIALQKVITPPVAPGTGQTVYLRLTNENLVTGQTFSIDNGNSSEIFGNATTCDIMVRAYSDEAGTIPLSVVGLIFSTSTQKFTDGVADGAPDIKPWILNSSSINTNYLLFKIIEADDRFFYSYFGSDGSGHVREDDRGNITYVQEIVASTTYVIIP